MLGGYISDRGKIEPRRRTGTCARHQRALAVAIKRARHLALLPFAPEHIYRMGDVAAINYPGIKVEPKHEVEKPEASEPAEAETAEATDETEDTEEAQASE